LPRPVPIVERADVSPDDLSTYDRVLERFRPGTDPSEPLKLDGYFGALLHSPPFAGVRQDISSMIRTAGERDNTYSHMQREFVDQVLAVELQTNVLQKRHVPDAVAVGVRIEAIDALRARRDEDLTDDERLLARFIRQVVNGTMVDETWDAMEAQLGTRGVVEYTFLITVIALTARQFQAFGMPDPSDSEIDKLLDDLRSGSQELPDWHKFIR
jgi:alkylhydroperoxidase family enzyme